MIAATQPIFLIGANRPQAGRTLLTILLADWIKSLDADPCVLADGDPARGGLMQRTGQAVIAVGTESDLPLNSVVDNADALARRTAGEDGTGDERNATSLARWLCERGTSKPLPPAIVCLLINDTSDADRAAVDSLRAAATNPSVLGMVVARNAGMPARFPSEADQRYAEAGGWPTSRERQSWLGAGGRELVLARPYPAMASQARGLGTDLSPAVQGHPSLWLTSRQQSLRWRRDFAARAARAFRPFMPGRLAHADV